MTARPRLRAPAFVPAFLCIFVAGAFGFVRGVHFYGNFFRGIIDARTYYATAHSLAIDGDLRIDNDLAESPEQRASIAEAPGHRERSREPSKFPVGLSLVEVPLLEFGRAIRWASALVGARSSAPSGFSWFEMLFVGLGLVAVFAASLALVYTMAAAEFGSWPAAAGLGAAWFGTSVFYYSSILPFMAHAMSFAALAVTMWATRAVRAQGRINGTLVTFAVAAGAEFLIRPQQIIVALVSLPVLVAAVRYRPPREWRLGAVVAVVLPACALMAQVLQLWLRSGRLSLTTYGAFGEGFSFLHPRFGIVLWHVRAGLIRVSPVVAVAAAGYLLRPRSIPSWVWPSVVNALLQIYLIASWWAPMQGETFGSRMWSDNAAVVVFGVAALAQDSRPLVRRCGVVTAVAATSWTMFLLSRYIGWPK